MMIKSQAQMQLLLCEEEEVGFEVTEVVAGASLVEDHHMFRRHRKIKKGMSLKF
jgi:hypothetical protein